MERVHLDKAYATVLETESYGFGRFAHYRPPLSSPLISLLNCIMQYHL